MSWSTTLGCKDKGIYRKSKFVAKTQILFQNIHVYFLCLAMVKFGKMHFTNLKVVENVNPGKRKYHVRISSIVENVKLGNFLFREPAAIL